jgi:hypothetical protein
MVNAAQLTSDDITAAMRKGDLYSSNGIFLKAYQKSQNNYHVSIDIDKTKAELNKQHVMGRHTQEKEGVLIEFIGEYGQVLKSSREAAASFSLPKTEKYVRAKITYSIKTPQGVQSFYALGQPVFIQ